jgi:hypothetical protein
VTTMILLSLQQPSRRKRGALTTVELCRNYVGSSSLQPDMLRRQHQITLQAGAEIRHFHSMQLLGDCMGLVLNCCGLCCGIVFQRGLRWTGNIQVEQRARCKKSRLENEPVRLPRRRRALSVPPQPSSFLGKSSAPQQSSSSASALSSSTLLFLPNEIRRQIFIEVVGGNVVHLVQLPKRLGHIRCDYDAPGHIGHDIDRNCMSHKEKKRTTLPRNGLSVMNVRGLLMVDLLYCEPVSRFTVNAVKCFTSLIFSTPTILRRWRS